MSRLSRSCLLEIDLVNLNLSVNKFVNIDNNTQTINVHENKARVNIIGDATVSTGCRPWVNDNTSLMFVGSELMGMACHKDIYI